MGSDECGSGQDQCNTQTSFNVNVVPECQTCPTLTVPSCHTVGWFTQVEVELQQDLTPSWYLHSLSQSQHQTCNRLATGEHDWSHVLFAIIGCMHPCVANRFDKNIAYHRMFCLNCVDSPLHVYLKCNRFCRINSVRSLGGALVVAVWPLGMC
jgi:hypothetical protein